MIDLKIKASYDVYLKGKQSEIRLIGNYPCRCVAEDVVNHVRLFYGHAYVVPQISSEEIKHDRKQTGSKKEKEKGV